MVKCASVLERKFAARTALLLSGLGQWPTAGLSPLPNLAAAPSPLTPFGTEPAVNVLARFSPALLIQQAPLFQQPVAEPPEGQ